MATLHGSAALCRVEDEAQGQMEWLAKNFPKEFGRALRHVGWIYRQEITAAVRSGGVTIGNRWERVSLMRQYRRMEQARTAGLMADGGVSTKAYDRLDLKRVSKKQRRLEAKGAAFKRSMFNRWKVPRSGLGATTPFGRLGQAVRYKYYQETQAVRIGFLTPSAAKFAQAVQAGERFGPTPGIYRKRQRVTDKMRRAFWAAGVPLSKNTTVLEQPERPIIQPVFDRMNPELPDIVEQRIYKIIAKSKGSVWPVLPVGK
ncbi:hypothetical protein [Halodesulfovibrio aestuarii]|uniref:hypothetical protein n=1 Tax=Halodesulfovibrio aestuarii TaxID=126333 RepID=UPI003D340058